MNKEMLVDLLVQSRHAPYCPNRKMRLGNI